MFGWSTNTWVTSRFLRFVAAAVIIGLLLQITLFTLSFAPPKSGPDLVLSIRGILQMVYILLVCFILLAVKATLVYRYRLDWVKVWINSCAFVGLVLFLSTVLASSLPPTFHGRLDDSLQILLYRPWFFGHRIAVDVGRVF